MLKRDSLQGKIDIDHSESFWGAEDGIQLYSQTWAPTAAPRGVINLIHGLGEHGGRYAPWAEKLALEGFIVRSFDQRGHGKSPGRRGYVSHYQKVLNDIELFLEKGREEYPSVPVFIYGHSLGGNLVINYIIQTLQSVDGIIVTSPWLELKNKPTQLALLVVSYLSRILPGVLVSNRIRVEDLSRDLRVVHSYRTDPLVHDRINLRFFRQCYEAGLKASMSIYKINAPLLIMHGSGDNVTSCKASGKFVQNASSKTKYVEWEGSYHELHNDLDKEAVFETLRKWLDQYAHTEKKKNA